jgi:hypothetical protein
VQPSCTRCARVSKACIFRPLERIPNTRRLEDKLAELELKFSELASQGEQPVSISPVFLARLDQFAKGKSICRARPFLPIFPDLNVTSAEACVTSLSHLEEGYGSLVHREIVEDALLSWNPNADMPRRLRECL